MPISPHTGTSTAWNLPSAMGSKSTWMVGFLGVIPVWLLKLAPNTSRQSLSFMNQLAIGVPLRPSTPQASGWRSGMSPFALKVVITGAWICSASAMTSGMWKRAPWPTMITGRLDDSEQGDRLIGRLRGRRDRASGQATPRRAGGGRRRGVLHFVGKDEVRHAAIEQRALAGQVHQLSVLAGMAAQAGSTAPPSRTLPPGRLPGMPRARGLACRLAPSVPARERDRRSHPRAR